ncbi:type II toxin-antitoxin system RelE/ParE family toxin [Streptomyces hydrogenans]
MVELYQVEMEPEVETWLAGLAIQQEAQVDAVVGKLLDAPTTLGMPRARHLAGKTWELRFNLGSVKQRITYWVAPGKRIVLLTQFRKTKQNERTEVARAIAKQEECEARHRGEPTHEYSRTKQEGEQS